MLTNKKINHLFPDLEEFVKHADKASAHLDQERIKLLGGLIQFVRRSLEDAGKVQLVFICTHNSRRSHFAQIWARVMSQYFGVSGVHTYSGGTEATAFNHRAVETLKNIGFSVIDPGGKNPHYQLSFSSDHEPLVAWSKTFDDPANPRTDFGAVMTCSDADENCPVVLGATKRISLHYQDPKESDGSPEEVATYKERCFQIATEMAYVMRQVTA
ncbi:MAG: protein-tyrosine-phosphatase [Saprospiraceae bacterium]|nr:protein-tyrosine-phosphatase [Saprospiraceae bacterium]